MKLHQFFIFLVSLILMLGCNNPQQEVGNLTPKMNKRSEKWGYVNDKGEKIIPFKYDNAGNFSEGLARVKLDSKYGYINKMGDMVVPLKYDNANDFVEGLARVKINGKYGYIDKNGDDVIQAIYDNASDFLDGLAVVGRKNSVNFNYGCIDKNGTLVTPMKYASIFPFSEGMAKVATGSPRYGFIDTTGQEVIPPKYNTADDFLNGMAFVSEGNKYGYIDKKGIGLLEKYTSKEMFFVWERLPISFSKLINEYRSKFNSTSKGSGNIKIKKPYLIINANEFRDVTPYNTLKREYAEIAKCSENDLTKLSIASLKTIIIRFAYFVKQEHYYQNNGRFVAAFNTYGTYLVYYDIQEGKCIGHDNLMAKKLPTSIQYNLNTKGDLFHSLDEVLQVINSHLVAMVE